MKKYKILVIDDNRSIRITMKDLLESEGYFVDSAANGEEGMKLLLNNQLPDIILLDLMMPVKDGIQFRLEQLSNPAIAQIPVILMTADCNTDVSHLKTNAFVTKPFDIFNMLDLVKKHIKENTDSTVS